MCSQDLRPPASTDFSPEAATRVSAEHATKRPRRPRRNGERRREKMEGELTGEEKERTSMATLETGIRVRV